jgi:Fe-S cluster biogenesis protein NfuA
MPENQDFQERTARIEELIRKVESTADPAVRASVKELMQSVMDLHAEAVNRMLEIVHEEGEEAARIMDALGADPLTGSLLILYGLHPQDTATRVTRALDKLQPTFRKHGAEVELEGMEDGVVRLRIGGVENSSSGKILKKAIEDQIYALAPDVTRVEGLAVLGSELVGIEMLVAKGGA